MSFIAQIPYAIERDLSIPFTLTGTATDTVDYDISHNPVIIPAGERVATITIDLIDDDMDEADETIVATMGTPSTGFVGPENFHVATIFDDDPSPTVSFLVAGSSGAESVATILLEVILSSPSSLAQSVDYATVAGTSATAGHDFIMSNGSLHFGQGETSKSINITIVDDSIPEPNESLIVRLSNPSPSTFGKNTTYTFVILSNDYGATTP